MRIQYQQLNSMLVIKDRRLSDAERALKQERDRRTAQDAEVQRCQVACKEAEDALKEFRSALFDAAVPKATYHQMMVAVCHADWMHMTCKSRAQDLEAARSRLALLDRALFTAESAVRIARRDREKTARQCEVVADRLRLATERRQEGELQEFVDLNSQRSHRQKAA